MRRRLIAILMLAGISGAAMAGGARKPWTLDAITSLKTVSDPQITADGSKVAYVVTSVDGDKNQYWSRIEVTRVDGSAPENFAKSSGSDAHPRWSPDGRILAFLSRRDGVSQIYAFTALDAPARKITQSRTPVTDFVWSHDGHNLGFLAADENPERESKKRTGDDPVVAGEGYSPTRVHVIKIDGTDERTITAREKHVLSFDWSPTDDKVVYAAQASPAGRDSFHVDIFETDLATGVERPIVVQPGQDLAPVYSPDGKWMAFHSQRGVLSYFGDRHVGVTPTTGGPIRYVTEHLDADVFGGATKFWWSQDGKKLIFAAGKGTSNSLYAVDISTGSSEKLPEVLAATSAFSVSRDGTRIAWIKSTPNAPGDVYVLDSTSGREVRLSDANPEVRKYEPVSASTIHWKSNDGLQVEGVLRLPFGYVRGRRVPLLVILHGGPTGVALESFPISRTYPTQLFLQDGFAVFEPNFRGSINYGPAFRVPTIEQQGIGDMNDVLSGIDWLSDQGIADPERLGIMGWSYGGYLSVWTIAHSQRFRAASIGACTTDWVSWYAPSIANKDAAPEVLWEYFGGKPWDRLDVYNQHSPRAYLKNIRTPSIVLHGENDIDSGPEVYVALRDLGVPVEYVTYPREGHGITEPMHQRDLMRRNLEWFEKWISTR